MDLRDTPYASCTIRPVHSDIPQRPQRDLLIPSGGIEHHIADMTATFAGDVTLREAQDKLAEAGQWLPMDGDESATLASLVEGNSTGPLRLGFGGWESTKGDASLYIKARVTFSSILDEGLYGGRQWNN